MANRRVRYQLGDEKAERPDVACRRGAPPATDSLNCGPGAASPYLTAEDLKRLTGRSYASAQKRVLRAQGIRYVEDANGRPVVHRAAVECVLLGKAKTPKQGPSPDFSVFPEVLIATESSANERLARRLSKKGAPDGTSGTRDKVPTSNVASRHRGAGRQCRRQPRLRPYGGPSVIGDGWGRS
jgi:hypothetical protein